MDTTPRYEPHEIEQKWQRVWEDERAFSVPNPVEGQPTAEKHWYQLEMLPYPSGPSLHMGHVLNYTMGDVQTHVRRRSGWHVVRPMGWDAFGLPAENAAIKEGRHPRVTIEANIETMRAQMKRLGWAIDWEREVAAHQPTFYRWTQWLFQQFVAHDLCYRKEGPVNWCPNDQTVIANEYVVDGHCERCGAEVEIRNMTQWFMRTTAYADELLEYPDAEWPEKTTAIQRNWIGRSEGAEVLFKVDETGDDIAVFTTRPDTLFGATFFVLAPEHPFVDAHASDEAKEYARRAGARSVEERSAATEKTGVFTGLHAVNPVNGEKMPIWVADYVLMDYGTGAIMAVPAHDERDGEFAETFSLPVTQVIDEDGKLINSGRFDGMPADEAKTAIVAEIGAKATVNYRLRDWSVSRQRYWGCPIPFIHCEKCGVVPVPESDLPVILPDIEDYAPKGMSPLAQNAEFMNVTCPSCGGAAQRDPDTMDTFVDSSWYFLRYIDSHNNEAPFDPFVVNYWLPVSQYIGGIDHSTGHLLYSRFFVKAMNDWGMVGFREPFARLFHQGWVTLGGTKMSKTKGNVEGPDEIVDRYGADAVRLTILFMGPADQDMEWTPAGADGIGRFLRRVWRLVHEVAAVAPASGEAGALTRKANETIARVTDDVLRRYQFHTPISAVMELCNEISAAPDAPDARFATETAVSLIQPYAPHIAEELWGVLGHERLWEAPWPEADESQLVRAKFELVVQVNGKVRDRFEADASLGEEELVALARGSERVAAFLDGAEPRKTIVVPGKLVNLVV
ncbi:MAG TPA: leucine--tRNA ligase [Gaiellaceae bacterium]